MQAKRGKIERAIRIAQKARSAYIETKKAGETIALTRKFIDNAQRTKELAENYIYDDISAEDIRLLGRVVIKTTPQIIQRVAKWRMTRER